MRIVVINPNSTVSMTVAIAAAVVRTLANGTECIGLTNPDAPAAIQGPQDGNQAVPGVLKLIRETPADGFIIACFDDTGLQEARSSSSAPVVGIGQASYHIANLLRPRFAVITTLQVSVSVIEDNIARSGFGSHCAGVHASGIPVLQLESDPKGSLERISNFIAQIEATAPDCAIILGCAGMGILKPALSARHDALILDPVECAGRLLPALICEKTD